MFSSNFNSNQSTRVSALEKAADIYFELSSGSTNRRSNKNVSENTHLLNRSESIDSNEYREISKAINKSLPLNSTAHNVLADNFRASNGGVRTNNNTLATTTPLEAKIVESPPAVAESSKPYNKAVDEIRKLMQTNEKLASNTRELKNQTLINFRATMEKLEMHEELLEHQFREIRRLEISLLTSHYQCS